MSVAVFAAELTQLVVDHGFMPIAAHEACLDEWDEFESGYRGALGLTHFTLIAV